MTTFTISLPDQIAKKIDTETEKKGFATRSEFIRTLVRSYFAKENVTFEAFEAKPLNEVRAELEKAGKYSKKFIDSIINGLKESSFYEG